MSTIFHECLFGGKQMRNKILVTVMFIVAILTLSAGCSTTTHKSAFVGTGAGGGLVFSGLPEMPAWTP